MNSNILKKIDKYMKYLTFVRSFSPLTIKSYKIDLYQYFFNKSTSELEKDQEIKLAKGQKNSNSSASNSDTSPDELTQYLKNNLSLHIHMNEKWSLSTRNRKISSLKSFLKWLYKDGHIIEDLNNKIRSPKIPSKVPHFLSFDDMLVLISTCQKDIKNPLSSNRALTLIYLLYGGGLRVSEACTAEWKNLDFDLSTLKIKGKGSKERIIALPEKVMLHLKTHYKKNKKKKDRYILKNPPMNPRIAYSIIRNCGIQAGLKKPISPHTLRHTYATHLLSSGSNLRILQNLLGHQSLSATQKYTQVQLTKLNQTLSDFHPLNKKKS